ncbi:MAG: rRNA maturation RNase YbeY, partial [Odoribacter sp.]|nr:rRNA maturation RNase YbeY [Odoribacter sp.]
VLSGDVFISLDTVASNAEEYQVSYRDEFHRVVCHSVLHLIGFKDKTEEDSKEMRKNENICLELLKTL